MTQPWSMERYGRAKADLQFVIVSPFLAKEWDDISILDAVEIWRSHPDVLFHTGYRMVGEAEDIDRALPGKNLSETSVGIHNFEGSMSDIFSEEMEKRRRMRTSQTFSLRVAPPPPSERTENEVERPKKRSTVSRSLVRSSLSDMLESLPDGKVVDVSKLREDGKGASVVNRPRTLRSKKISLKGLNLISSTLEKYLLALEVLENETDRDLSTYKTQIRELIDRRPKIREEEPKKFSFQSFWREGDRKELFRYVRSLSTTEIPDTKAFDSRVGSFVTNTSQDRRGKKYERSDEEVARDIRDLLGDTSQRENDRVDAVLQALEETGDLLVSTYLDCGSGIAFVGALLRTIEVPREYSFSLGDGEDETYTTPISDLEDLEDSSISLVTSFKLFGVADLLPEISRVLEEGGNFIVREFDHVGGELIDLIEAIEGGKSSRLSKEQMEERMEEAGLDVVDSYDDEGGFLVWHCSKR